MGSLSFGIIATLPVRTSGVSSVDPKKTSEQANDYNLVAKANFKIRNPLVCGENILWNPFNIVFVKSGAPEREDGNINGVFFGRVIEPFLAASSEIQGGTIFSVHRNYGLTGLNCLGDVFRRNKMC